MQAPDPARVLVESLLDAVVAYQDGLPAEANDRATRLAAQRFFDATEFQPGEDGRRVLDVEAVFGDLLVLLHAAVRLAGLPGQRSSVEVVALIRHALGRLGE